jgi:hypothetical protein
VSENIKQGEYTMPSLETGKPTISQMDVIKSAWNKIRTQLENEKARIYQAIGNYPPPTQASLSEIPSN